MGPGISTTRRRANYLNSWNISFPSKMRGKRIHAMYLLRWLNTCVTSKALNTGQNVSAHTIESWWFLLSFCGCSQSRCLDIFMLFHVACCHAFLYTFSRSVFVLHCAIAVFHHVSRRVIAPLVMSFLLSSHETFNISMPTVLISWSSFFFSPKCFEREDALWTLRLWFDNREIVLVASVDSLKYC